MLAFPCNSLATRSGLIVFALPGERERNDEATKRREEHSLSEKVRRCHVRARCNWDLGEQVEGRATLGIVTRLTCMERHEIEVTSES
jgi:hypothetical protein